MLQALNPSNKNNSLINSILNGDIIDMRNVDLSNSNIDSDKAIQLFDKFIKMPHLRKIDLSWNNIGYQAAHSIRTFLENHSTISELILNCNMLGDYGTQEIFQGVARNPSIKILSLSTNGIKSGSAEAIGKAMRSNPSLTLLNLSSMNVELFARYKANDLGYDTAKQLKISLFYNSSITCIDIENSFVPFISNNLRIYFSERIKIIKSIIKQHEKEELSIKDLAIANRYMPAILEMLKENPENAYKFEHCIYNMLSHSTIFASDNPLTILPLDVMNIIFSYLDNVSIARFTSTAKMVQHQGQEITR